MTRAISIREFLRGGYKTVNEMTVVTSHGHPIGTWIPTYSDRRTPTAGQMMEMPGPALEEVLKGMGIRKSSSR